MLGSASAGSRDGPELAVTGCIRPVAPRRIHRGSVRRVTRAARRTTRREAARPMRVTGPDTAGVRERLGSALFARVAGPEGPENRARIHDTPGPRWFGPDRPIRTVHGDASMFIGGLSALLLQS